MKPDLHQVCLFLQARLAVKLHFRYLTPIRASVAGVKLPQPPRVQRVLEPQGAIALHADATYPIHLLPEYAPSPI